MSRTYKYKKEDSSDLLFNRRFKKAQHKASRRTTLVKSVNPEVANRLMEAQAREAQAYALLEAARSLIKEAAALRHDASQLPQYSYEEEYDYTVIRPWAFEASRPCTHEQWGKLKPWEENEILLMRLGLKEEDEFFKRYYKRYQPKQLNSSHAQPLQFNWLKHSTRQRDEGSNPSGGTKINLET